MANYKTADKLPILEEVTETTYALVEDSGVLKRVAGSNLGGGNGNFCIINVDKTNVAVPSDVESSDSDGTTYTCNMTYSELLEALQNKTLTSVIVNLYNSSEIYCAEVNHIYYGSDAPGILIGCFYDRGNQTISLQFTSDDTISEYVKES